MTRDSNTFARIKATNNMFLRRRLNSAKKAAQAAGARIGANLSRVDGGCGSQRHYEFTKLMCRYMYVV